MSVSPHACARAGLVGNPSDGYFGKTISIVVRDFRATATCRAAPQPILEPPSALLEATAARFATHARRLGRAAPLPPAALRVETDIPGRVGLAGSSAIIIAALRALARHHDVPLSDEVLPGMALAIEVEDLGIPAGLQDRVIQTLEGVVFMDFERGVMARDGRGRYERLDPALLPPLFLAWDERLAQGTEVVHGDLRRRWNDGERRVVEAMTRFAELAQTARDRLRAGRGDEIGPLMDENFDLRAAICPIPPGHRRLVETGREHGAAVKFAGSGGAVVGAFDGDPQRFARLREAYAAIGATVIRPTVAVT